MGREASHEVRFFEHEHQHEHQHEEGKPYAKAKMRVNLRPAAWTYKKVPLTHSHGWCKSGLSCRTVMKSLEIHFTDSHAVTPNSPTCIGGPFVQS